MIDLTRKNRFFYLKKMCHTVSYLHSHDCPTHMKLCLCRLVFVSHDTIRDVCKRSFSLGQTRLTNVPLPSPTDKTSRNETPSQTSLSHARLWRRRTTYPQPPKPSTSRLISSHHLISSHQLPNTPLAQSIHPSIRDERPRLELRPTSTAPTAHSSAPQSPDALPPVDLHLRPARLRPRRHRSGRPPGQPAAAVIVGRPTVSGLSASTAAAERLEQ